MTSTTESVLPSYTTAGRHRREIGTGRIRVVVRRSADLPPTLLVNGFPVVLGRGETVIQVPAGPMCLQVQHAGATGPEPAAVEFALGEGACVEVRFAPSRAGLRSARLELAS